MFVSTCNDDCCPQWKKNVASRYSADQLLIVTEPVINIWKNLKNNVNGLGRGMGVCII